MSQVNENANLTISVKGLAIYYFNETDKKWEFLFLRHLETHDLKIKVTKMSAAGGDDTELAHEFVLDKGHDIVIEADTVPYMDGADNYRVGNGSFDYSDADETSRKNDIRWIIDLPKPIPGFPEDTTSVMSNYKKRNLTFVSFPENSIVYTKELSSAKFNRWERTLSTGNRRLAAESSSKIGVTLGADVQCNSSFKLKIDGTFDYDIEFKIEGNDKYLLEFDNSCDPAKHPGCEHISDLIHNYDLFDVDEYLELTPVPVLERDEITKVFKGGTGSMAACGPSGSNPGRGSYSLKDWRSMFGN